MEGCKVEKSKNSDKFAIKHDVKKSSVSLFNGLLGKTATLMSPQTLMTIIVALALVLLFIYIAIKNFVA